MQQTKQKYSEEIQDYIDQEQKLDFNDEIKEFIEQGFIKDYIKIQDDKNGFIVSFKTLENYYFVVQCSVCEAIVIIKSDHPDVREKQFECWEQLLNLYSLKYVEKFHNLINQKLESLEQM